MNLSHLFMIQYKAMTWELNNEHRKELKWWKKCNVSTLKCAKGLKTNVRLTLCKLQPVSCLWQMTTNSKNRPCEFTYHMSRFKYRKVMCSKCQVLPERKRNGNEQIETNCVGRITLGIQYTRLKCKYIYLWYLFEALKKFRDKSASNAPGVTFLPQEADK